MSRALQLGKSYYQSNFNVNLKLPIAWCAPECIHDLLFTIHSDIWAYGITLWEIFTYGFTPWAGLTGRQILEMIDAPRFGRLDQPDACPDPIYDAVMRACWAHEPKARPTFAQLLGKLFFRGFVEFNFPVFIGCTRYRLISLLFLEPFWGPVRSGRNYESAVVLIQFRYRLICLDII
ncbi:unnamed protein product [Schistosoma margrebowiei]|uniref:Uncharacterized protein n=1 Tax=Schistosoma margrebowiei TaxID=48269 RepID=A0A183MK71_9TREM|nr:unnamed protein product [Schistosoma margrebowiei]